VGLKQERRVGIRELPEPPDQLVAIGGALGSPLSGPKARWLALVAGPFSVIAQLCSADRRGVRVGFRDEAASARRPLAAVGISPAGQSSQPQEPNARKARRMDVRRISADLSAAVPLPDLRLAEPLARLVADHERRVDEQDSVTVCGCCVRPADRLPDAACPAGVQDLAVPVYNRHAGLIGQKVAIALSPGEVNTDEASICHTDVIPPPYLVLRRAAVTACVDGLRRQVPRGVRNPKCGRASTDVRSCS
jgi:hypothetical protein